MTTCRPAPLLRMRAALVLALLAGGAAAGYTAFLFGQAKGRAFWQSPLLLPHLVVQAALAGAGGLAAFVTASRFGGRPSWAGFGALYIVAPCVALIWLREAVDYGRALTFTLFAIVWAADSGAYFVGRFIGGPRISRALSPEKTWAGVIGGRRRKRPPTRRRLRLRRRRRPRSARDRGDR